MYSEVILIAIIFKNNQTSALHSLRNDFGASLPLLLAKSALTFRCKLCIPLGTTLELLRLLLSAESALTFRCKLCIPLGTTLELLPCFLFGTRWCVLSLYIYIPWGILLL